MDRVIIQAVLQGLLYQENHSPEDLSIPTDSFKIVLLSLFTQRFEDYWASSKFIRFLLLSNNFQLVIVRWMLFYKLLKSIKCNQVLRTWWDLYSLHQQMQVHFLCLFSLFTSRVYENFHSFCSQLFASFPFISNCLKLISNVLVFPKLPSTTKRLYSV